MGDRTSFNMTVYRLDPAKADDFWAQVDSYTDASDRCDDGTFGDDGIGIGFAIHEQSCGTVAPLASALAELDPTAIWIISEDPKYEWLGEVAVHHPDFPLFTSECDADGQPVLSASVIAHALADPDTALDKIRDAAGLDVLEAVRQQAAGMLIRCQHCLTKPGKNGQGEAPCAICSGTTRTAPAIAQLPPPPPREDGYTVIGVWVGDDPIPVGTVRGRHSVGGGDPDGHFEQGVWATYADGDEETAESAAVDEMRATLADDDEDGS